MSSTADTADALDAWFNANYIALVTSRITTISLALLVAACGSESSPKEVTPTATATSSASGASTASATASAPALKAAKAKAFKSTSEQELGTLPEGVGVPVGEAAPDFELPSVEGGKVKLSELTKKSEVMLVFYRGGW